MEIGPQSRVACKNLILQLRAGLVNAQLPEGRFIRDFPGYIFYTGKNHNGKLKDVIVFKLEDGTNVTTTVRAPSGQVETGHDQQTTLPRLVRRAQRDVERSALDHWLVARTDYEF